MRIFLFCILLLSCFAGQAQTAAAPAIVMRVEHAPAPGIINGKHTLFYEIFLTNFSALPLQLMQLEILTAEDTVSINFISGDEIARRLYMPGTKPGAVGNPVLPPGRVAVLYIEATISGNKMPGGIIHRLMFKDANDSTSPECRVYGAATRLENKPVLVLGAPLVGGPWTAIYDPSWERGHRRMIFTREGVARIPGRYAIDFVKLDNHANFTAGNPDPVKNWFGYGADVLAVADGVISSVNNSFPESAMVSGLPAYAAEQATGNYISLKISADAYVFYEHLQPGSISVKPGQRVKKGDVIGRLGFTGQSTGPHLHLHVANANAPLRAEGLPFVFEKFKVSGAYPNLENFGKESWQPLDGGEKEVRKEHPASNSVIVF
ncbi:peptidase M23-like protein [Chitinophaga niastensis]|uniref:Peptidase M23-like protein n=1 Tax=Chitinophaga niastensis TaxID=536980 RepID=A0A2P8HVT7_CHINA|nr:M23 family metallopeptidase [Chitinophaga niastensis]PSL50351.1 peptidase M23-like protein [Chitinophaga niastensis]